MTDASDSTESSDAIDATRTLAVVVPCYNESAGIDQLFNSLRVLEESLDDPKASIAVACQLEFILVDDGSDDDTLSKLRAACRNKARYKVLSHPSNYGITAAFETGLKSTDAEWVACIDADCTYQPNQLLTMLPLMAPGVSAVTASPYHPSGRVDGVVGWRLALSKSASFIYSRLFKHKLYTYTSCFRVYRRAHLLDIAITRPGFVGITEILWKLDQLDLADIPGGRILEAPATLQRRQFGVSKMSVVKTGIAHLGLMTQIIAQTLSSTMISVFRRRREPSQHQKSALPVEAHLESVLPAGVRQDDVTSATTSVPTANIRLGHTKETRVTESG